MNIYLKLQLLCVVIQAVCLGLQIKKIGTPYTTAIAIGGVIPSVIFGYLVVAGV